ncbi:MAG: T9SS type A sorting domain-containing protein [Bacteroidales bacterium]
MTKKNILKPLIAFILCILTGTFVTAQEKASGVVSIRDANIGGYMIANVVNVNTTYNAGYSMYAAAWPLVREYPGRNFQSGLFGTWMFPQNNGPLPVTDFYTDIEGGLGWWRDTEYATETPKFIMGGVQLNFVGWANGPGAGQGRDWNNPKGKYGVAQLSPWVLWPPDGLTLKQGTCGELFGSGYLPLPLTEPKSTTAGIDVPTGNQCWTLFLNTGNFKGPVAFFTPYFWSEASVNDPRLGGLFLDQRPSQANKGFQMETQHIRSAEATDSKGQIYARVAPTQYPVGPDGNSDLLHRLMVYKKKALWDKVEAWFKGGAPADGTIDLAGASMQKFQKGVWSTWSLYGDHIPADKRANLNFTSYLNANVTDNSTLRVRWEGDLITQRETGSGTVVTLPEYYKLVKTGNNDPGEWIAVAPGEVPAETGLHDVVFSSPDKRTPVAYITPANRESCWNTPGPVAGPFEANLGDGSTVTYFWYRFADQPALLNADLSKEEREEMQRRVELLHRNWTKDREYLPAPTIGKLADIDPALIVTPPEGLEAGYVPIVIRQKISEVNSTDRNVFDKLPAIEVYPNPASHFLNILLQTAPGSNTKLQLMDITGKIIQTVKLYKTREVLDIGFLSDGLYILNFTNGVYSKFIKFFKSE